MDKNSIFPKINSSTQKGDIGLTIIKEQVESELKWLFRQNHLEHDFGIDGFMDVITDSNQITGKSIAFQAKTGKSYLSEENEIGFVFRGDNKHLNYYLNLEIPIIIILVDDVAKVSYWEVFDGGKTEKAGESWKITIPKKQVLNAANKELLKKNINPITDYAAQLEEQWKINHFLKSGTDRIIFRIPKTDVESFNHLPILTALNRIQATTDLILHLKSKVDISFDGYDFDNRELFEIAEVKKWVLELLEITNCLPYLMAMDKAAGFMKLLFFSSINTIRTWSVTDEIFKVEYNSKELEPLLDKLFTSLNEYCEISNLSEETNKEITHLIINHFSDGKYENMLKDKKNSR